MSDRVAFTCNGGPVEVDVDPEESLLTVLRERLRLRSVKDGCAPQGQCGCCTVLVDGEARVSCVTPASRVAGRAVVTVEGLDAETRARWAGAFLATGGSQCGFCTPGIVMRGVALSGRDVATAARVDRALAAHLCRCTGWTTVRAACVRALDQTVPAPGARDLGAASRRAALEGGTPQTVSVDVPLGGGAFADDSAPRDALVAVPRSPGSTVPGVDAAGFEWVVAGSVEEARAGAGKVQGRRSTIGAAGPLAAPDASVGGVALATGWVEPAYLEPDASWCLPAGEPSTPLANGGAFGGKTTSIAPLAARELATRLGRPVRVLLGREDVVRLGPKRPPIAATARLDGATLRVEGRFVAPRDPDDATAWSDAAIAAPNPYGIAVDARWEPVEVPGPPTSSHLRAAGFAETVVLLEGALDAVGADRADLVADEIERRVLLDTCVRTASGSCAGAGVRLDPERGVVDGVEVRLAAGEPLDVTVLRSYAIGAAHMALGWVLSEGIAIEPRTGEVHDLTIRSFGIVRARDVPDIDVTIVADPRPPLARSSDAVFAAVAAATWNAIARVDAARPVAFPARDTRAGRALRR